MALHHFQECAMRTFQITLRQANRKLFLDNTMSYFWKPALENKFLSQQWNLGLALLIMYDYLYKQM